MLRAMKRAFIVPALLLAFQSHAATEDLDSLLTSIKSDIQNQRLSSPAGNNALERITAFREQAPFDFRVVPLTYQWGEAYVALADAAIAKGQIDKAQGYLDKVWYVASLTPGLEEMQAKVDAAGQGAKTAAKGGAKQAAKTATQSKPKGPSKAELARQKKVAAAAAKEKARLEAERKRKLEQAKREALAEKKRLQAELKRKQEQERQRRLAAAKAEKEAAAKRAAAAKAQKAGKKVVAKAAPVPVVKTATASEVQGARALWQSAKENTAPLASYPVDAEMVANRDRSIAENLEPVCIAILENDASVVLHTSDKADYRWLTVRLTLGLRRLDSSFRLRHSHQPATGDEPFITLHPSRGVSLVRQVER